MTKDINRQGLKRRTQHHFFLATWKSDLGILLGVVLVGKGGISCLQKNDRHYIVLDRF